MFQPKLFSTLKNYSRKQLSADLISGLVVGIVALPLAIAFAIASGVSPEKGLFTAIIAGFIISAFGGSRVQIGGPTGAFIVIVYAIVQKFGVDGLITATFMAGIMLIIMGLARLGSVIKFIPYPLIIGFTSGIALIIFSSQMKDLFGLEMGAVPSEFLDKWSVYFANIRSFNFYAIGIASLTIFLIWAVPKIIPRVPGSIVAIILSTAAVMYFQLPVETIGSRFGAIPSSLPFPVIPHVDYATIKELIQPAFTIALLGGIESLLSAVVADGMIGGNHKSNIELVAQGAANIFSAIFGGIPATGAIARTATNVKNGGRTPIAGITHALTLLVIMLFFGKWATLIPLSCLAGILVVVAFNMSEWHSFVAILKGARADSAVLLTTFFLTVLVDLTVAIEIGMLLAMFLFMRQVIAFSKVKKVTDQIDYSVSEGEDPKAISKYKIPVGVEVFEIEGPFFFGAAFKFRDSMRFITKPPQVLIIRMRFVPMIDASGINVLEEVYKQTHKQGTSLVISGVQPQVEKELEKHNLLVKIGGKNVVSNIETALERAQEIITRPNETV